MTKPFSFCLRLLIALTIIQGIVACTHPQILEPEIPVETHRQRAALLTDSRQFAEAEQEIAQALLKAPDDPLLHLLHGELLEVLDRHEEAAQTYRKGIDGSNDPVMKNTLTHRLGLVELLELEHVEEAKKLAGSLPAKSLEKIDLAGVIALAEGRPVNALKTFSKAPNVTSRTEMAAWIRYHAAQAYYQLGDERNTRAALYVAVNNVESLALKKAIEVFWNKINPTH